MERRFIAVLFLSLLAVMVFVSGALADKLLCVSNQGLQAADSINTCIAKGEEFAVADSYGIVHILTPREVELTRSLNPQAFEQPAYGLKYHKEAPEMKIFGSVPIPRQ